MEHVSDGKSDPLSINTCKPEDYPISLKEMMKHQVKL
jgi:hypothetical protein